LDWIGYIGKGRRKKKNREENDEQKE